MAPESKRRLHAELLNKLTRDRDVLQSSQREVAEGVTHEDNRAEGDKDMRATEASYLARGQAMRVLSLEEDVQRVAAMAVREFGDEDPIAISALVELIVGRVATQVFIAPAGGGVRLGEGGAIQVVTPASPIGRVLIGSRVGDEVDIDRAGRVEAAEILRVS